MKKFLCTLFAIISLVPLTLCACSGESGAIDASTDSDDEVVEFQTEETSDAEQSVEETAVTPSNVINLAECEVGDELPVYPDYTFNYQLNDGTLFHIQNITATLTEINIINEGATLTEEYYPYVITVKATATVELSGTLQSKMAEDESYAPSFRFGVSIMPEYILLFPMSYINDDYTIEWETTVGVFNAENIRFLGIR